MITITLNGRRATASNLEPLYIGNENSIPVKFVVDPADAIWNGALLVAIFVAITPQGRRIAQPAVIDETGMTSIPDKILYYSGSQVGVGLRGTFETNEEVASNLASLGVSIDGAGGEVLSDIDITEEDESVFAQFTDMIADFMDQANDRIEDAEEAVGEIGDRINEAMQPYSTTEELEPMLVYSGTVGTGTIEGGATVFTASVAGLTNEAIQDGTKIMLHAQAGSAGDLETVRKLRIGADGVEGLLYMAQERPETMITYPWSAGAVIIVTAVTVDAARAWRVDDIYQRATEGIYGVVSVQDTVDGSRARLGVAASPFAVSAAVKAAVPDTTAADAGKELRVNGQGKHVWMTPPPEIPTPTAGDDGKYLKATGAGGVEWGEGGGGSIQPATADTLGGVKVAQTNSVKTDENGRLQANVDAMAFVRMLATVFFANYYKDNPFTCYMDDPAEPDSAAHTIFINNNEAVIDMNVGAFVFVAARDVASWEYEDENYDHQTISITAGSVYVMRLIDDVLEFREATNSILYGLICYGLDWKGE